MAQDAMTEVNVVPINAAKAKRTRKARKEEQDDESFIKLMRRLRRYPAWRAIMRSGAVRLLIEIWWRYNGRNNGAIPYSVDEAAEFLDCSPNTIRRWFRELREAGFIVLMRGGSFHQKTGQHRAREWRLTMEPYLGRPATHDYRDFPENGDCEWRY
jgi:hypothetical protein